MRRTGGPISAGLADYGDDGERQSTKEAFSVGDQSHDLYVGILSHQP
jgi:hypothetical protein